MGIAVLAIANAIAATGVSIRLSAEAALERRASEQAIPSVKLIAPSKSPPIQELVLPGNVQALIESPIYARTSGYIKSWRTDIGAHVKRGDLLAEIDAPDVDDQYRQAVADLKQAEANWKLAKVTAERWRILLKSDSVARQDADQKEADAEADEAAVASARANASRLRQLQEYERVTAPFDGIVTARGIDVGTLIDSGSGTNPQLFRVADASKLRIYVQVPESSAARVRTGMAAQLHFAEFPGREFPAQIVRSAGAVDPTARTMLVELQTDNSKGELFPGGYTEVHFQIPVAQGSIRLPINALLFRPEGVQVAMVSNDGTVEIRDVRIGVDFGNELEIVSGVSVNEKVIINPSDSIAAGQKVRVEEPQPAPAK